MPATPACTVCAVPTLTRVIVLSDDGATTWESDAVCPRCAQLVKHADAVAGYSNIRVQACKRA